MKILCFAGSLRSGSYNKKFVRAAMAMLESYPQVTAEYVDLKDYVMPPYDGDIESSSGLPSGALSLGGKIREADALVISTPEYNGSIPGVLKNVVDWLSREKPVSLENKSLLLLAASPGALGGVRSLWHTRVPFEVLGVHVYPTMMGLPGANEAFAEDGSLKDEKRRQQLAKLIEQYIKHIS